MASDEREYDLNPDEIVVGIVVPPSSGPNATYEVRQREALDWPLATASVALKLNGQKVEQASIVLGHVAPVPWDAKSAAQGLQGKTLNEETAAIAGKAATSGAKSLSRNGYKIRLAQVAVKRALLLAAGKEV
jgi:xanthine dehydrogenase YagS FAD-binding subunit